MRRLIEVTLACEVVTVETVVEVAGSVVLFIESGAVRPDSESKLWESIFAPSGDSSCGLNIWKGKKQFVFPFLGYVSPFLYL